MAGRKRFAQVMALARPSATGASRGGRSDTKQQLFSRSPPPRPCPADATARSGGPFGLGKASQAVTPLSGDAGPQARAAPPLRPGPGSGPLPPAPPHSTGPAQRPTGHAHQALDRPPARSHAGPQPPPWPDPGRTRPPPRTRAGENGKAANTHTDIQREASPRHPGIPPVTPPLPPRRTHSGPQGRKAVPAPRAHSTRCPAPSAAPGGEWGGGSERALRPAPPHALACPGARGRWGRGR